MVGLSSTIPTVKFKFHEIIRCTDVYSNMRHRPHQHSGDNFSPISGPGILMSDVSHPSMTDNYDSYLFALIRVAVEYLERLPG